MIGRRVGALLMLAMLAGASAAQEDAADAERQWQTQNAVDAERLTQALDAVPGSVLAEVGAGPEAPLTIPMARHVGPSGRVYATELDRKTINGLRKTIKDAGLRNVTIIKGHPSRTNLPAGCCEGIFMRNVYHHFDDPQAMNASLFRTLKPGGRLAIIDLLPRGREADSPEDRDNDDQHVVSIKSVTKELLGAGFEMIASERRADGSFLVTMQKPATPR